MATSVLPRWLPLTAAAVAVCAGIWLSRSQSASEGAALPSAAPPAGDRAASAPPRRRAEPSDAIEADADPDAEEAGQARSSGPARARVARARPSAPRPGARGAFLDAADPCEPLAEPEIPASFASVHEADVTVAWPPEVDVREPTALAFMVAGLVQEAARATGSEAREQLTVFLYASRDELNLATGTPEWASGVYDGAVHVFVEPGLEFGVRVSTLRHEVMHAQLHTGVGCIPAWFNEGAAQHFAGPAPVATWIELLKSRADIDFDALSVPTIAEAPKDDAPLLYAQSLAMLLHVMDRSGGLAEIVQGLQASASHDPRQRARTLWSALSPATSAADVRDSLARRLFGVGSERDARDLLHGPVCCVGEQRISELACRAQAEERAPVGGPQAAWRRCRSY